MRAWWNWQTHQLEGLAPRGIQVQVLSRALASFNEERKGDTLFHGCDSAFGSAAREAQSQLRRAAWVGFVESMGTLFLDF